LGKFLKKHKCCFEAVNLRVAAERFNIKAISEDDNYIYLYFCQNGDFSMLDISNLYWIIPYSGIYVWRRYFFKLKKTKVSENSIDYIKIIARFGFTCVNVAIKNCQQAVLYYLNGDKLV
jgi:hypothetical protein